MEIFPGGKRNMRKFLKILTALIAVCIIVVFAGKMLSGQQEQEYVYERSDRKSNDFSTLVLSQPYSKNSEDLVAFVNHAWANGWGYVWGSFGDVLDNSSFDSIRGRYSSAIAPYEDFIYANWLGYRCADCSGLIKAYGWYEPGIGINYGANDFPDRSADGMFETATEYGSIDTIPEIPGIAVWCEGHIGVYIGNGTVIEAMGTEYGVVKTKLEGYTGSRWTHWLKLDGINYN